MINKKLKISEIKNPKRKLDDIEDNKKSENIKLLRKKIRISKKKVFILFLFIVAILFLIYIISNFFKNIFGEKNLISNLNKILVLPGEVTQIREISDAKVLKEQSNFFNGVENGDKLFLFSDSNFAIIYRPDKNKIIKIIPINYKTEK